uniref:T-box domain-containing protein n=1 Tax=Gadus morhua TaxID=8049 RepID=A0A8C5CL21_GADMO
MMDLQPGHSPAVLRFKGISVTLENNSVWKQFHSYGTEMILTKSGRRMFPYCRYRLSGLNPSQRYSLVLSIVPADQHKYRWNTKKWEVIGAAEYQAQGLIRAFPHQNSPCLGSEWMNTLVSFYKLKLTNNMSDQEGHMILHSMHRYIPRLHVIPVLDGDGPTSMTFTFPQTEFVTVTTYQNPWIIQLKINHNPFAKGFREEGIHPRLFKPKLGDSPGTKEAQSPVTKPAEDDDNDGGAMEISMEKTPVYSVITLRILWVKCSITQQQKAASSSGSNCHSGLY